VEGLGHFAVKACADLMRGLSGIAAENATLSAIDTRVASRQVIARFQSRIPTVAKPELGTKRVCPTTGRKFYDLNKNPVISPYTGQVVPIETTPVRSRPEPVARAPVPAEEVEAPEAAEAEFVSLEEADAEAQGGSAKVPAGEADEEVEVDDESLDDAAFIVPEEEEDEDVTDIIGGDIEDEEES
jgi:uncharacterized protein (TIGR02300 family)